MRKAAKSIFVFAIITMAIIAVAEDSGLAAPKVSSPTHPSAEWTKNNKPRFNWDAVAGAAKYKYTIDDSNSTVPTKNETTLTTAYFSNVNDGEKYFHVSACGDTNCGPAAHYLLRIDVTPPLPPEDGNGISLANGGIMVSWSVPKDASGIKEYNVYRSDRQKTRDRDFLPNDGGVKKFTTTETFFVDSDGLAAGKDYYYRVQAIDNTSNISAAGRMIRAKNIADANAQQGEASGPPQASGQKTCAAEGEEISTMPLPDGGEPIGCCGGLTKKITGTDIAVCEKEVATTQNQDSNKPAITQEDQQVPIGSDDTGQKLQAQPETDKSYGEQKPQDSGAGQQWDSSKVLATALVGIAIVALLILLSSGKVQWHATGQQGTKAKQHQTAVGPKWKQPKKGTVD